MTLRKGGVRVEPFRPLRPSALHLAQNRSHMRGVVVEGKLHAAQLITWVL